MKPISEETQAALMAYEMGAPVQFSRCGDFWCDLPPNHTRKNMQHWATREFERINFRTKPPRHETDL